MLKKIAIGALLTGLVVVLVLGAVTRTNAVNGESAGDTGRWGRTTENGTADAGLQDTYGGRGAAANATEGLGGGWWKGTDTPSGIPQADVQPAEWRTVKGTVFSVADGLVEIRTAAGEMTPFEGRPLSYALEQGLDLQVGDAVALAGFDEDGEFKIGQVTNLEDGTSIVLRDTTGRPGWSGRGRRGQ